MLRKIQETRALLQSFVLVPCKQPFLTSKFRYFAHGKNMLLLPKVENRLSDLGKSLKEYFFRLWETCSLFFVYFSPFPINDTCLIIKITALHCGYKSENTRASPRRAKQLLTVSAGTSLPGVEKK